MVVFEKIVDLRKYLADKGQKHLSIGFVPTMGALHRGHISLVERSTAENKITIVSVFVNPTQFNNPDDLKKYPRTREKDLHMLESAKVDAVFMPPVDEMYPKNEIEDRHLDFGMLEKVMEGKYRPGHFKGVAQVVSKLFEIVTPDRAYFGEKDFQQLTIIRELVKQKNYPIEIVGCETIREENGLAMSSRNMLLTDEERVEAAKISKGLFFIRDNWRTLSVEEAKERARQIIEATGKMKIEYLEIAEEETLERVTDWSAETRLRCFAAVKAGNVRLIDNVSLNATFAV